MAKFELEDWHRDVADKDLLGDLQKVATECGGRITRRIYKSDGRYSDATIARRFGSWNAALSFLNITLNARRDIYDEQLFENILSLWTKYGRQPRRREVTTDKDSKISGSTYERRFGTWMDAMKAFVDYANQDEVAPPKGGSESRKSGLAGRKRDPSLALRFCVLKRDGFKCKACGRSPSTTPGLDLHVDHVLAFSRGGLTELDNLQTLCSTCNLGKGAKH